jgi:hypothetical protein
MGELLVAVGGRAKSHVWGKELPAQAWNEANGFVMTRLWQLKMDVELRCSLSTVLLKRLLEDRVGERDRFCSELLVVEGVDRQCG